MILDSFNSSYVDGLPYVAITYPFYKHDALYIHDMEAKEIIKLVNSREIKKVYIDALEDIAFLSQCQTIEHLAIELRIPFDKLDFTVGHYEKKFDLTPIYDLPKLKSLEISETEIPFVKMKCNVDISRLPNIVSYSGSCKYLTNLAKATTLKSLYIINYKPKTGTFEELENLKQLDTINLSFSSLKSLKGIGSFPKLTCLYMNDNRSLENVDDLSQVKASLRALRIENCLRINSFSFLATLNGLELLELWGKNELESLSFLTLLTNLKTFAFNTNIHDGDLSCCDNIPMVHSEVDRRHYNRKNSDLPKVPNDMIVRGNETIEHWRRLE